MASELPLTEYPNPASQNLDQMDIGEIIALMREEDQKMLKAFDGAETVLAKVIAQTVDCLRSGGRLIYIGAGTSGRLGVLDAAECPPTFRTPPGMVVGLIAGGRTALEQAVEGAEDSSEAALADLAALNIQAQDMLIGIAASGNTPYVRAALRQGRSQGLHTALLACSPVEQNDPGVEFYLVLPVGPEILTGSTRLKAGTVTKLALNMISTISMIQLGKVYGNRMIDVTISNAKLRRRAVRILQELCEVPESAAQNLLEQASGEVKTALMMHWGDLDADLARNRLQAAGGHLRKALETNGEPRPA
ncbi:MAG: N-acetylmuramic acid 6-phosphate etherase [Candidatus Sericytochromatia bacterium]